MPKRSNSKKRTVKVEAWGDRPARTVAQSVDWVRRTWGWMWADGRAQSGDLVRVQAQAQVHAQSEDLVTVLAQAEVQVQAESEDLVRVPVQAEAEVQAQPDAEVQARPTEDLMRVLAQAQSVAFALTRALEQAEAEAEADVEAEAVTRVLALEARAESQAKSQAESQAETEAIALELAEVDAQVQVQVKAKVQASLWAMELARVHHAMRAWMQASGPIQAQTWLRVGALEAYKVQVERDLWPRHRQDYWWLSQIITPITRLPPEILQQIFLILIDDDNDSPLVLMLVSKYWYNVVTGFWASLKLGTTTTKEAVIEKLERNQRLLDVAVNTNIGLYDAPINFNIRDAYQGIFAAMQATSRWRRLEIVALPAQVDLPEDLVNRGLQQCSGPALSHLRTFIIKCCLDMSPLLNRLLHILGNTASRELTTVTINSENVISFLVPTYSSIFHSVTVLSLDAPWLRNPVDLLPHLHQLEDFTASHLPLPVYQNDVDFPFVHTLRHLKLTSVSIQWMSGRTFHVLQSCKLFPSFDDPVLPTFRTALPTCEKLSFKSHSFDILKGASAPKLIRLSVTCYPLCKERGSPQLVRFASRALRASRLTPQILHITIEATDRAWRKALAFMSNVEELVIYNARPSSLGAKSLQPLVVLPVQANNTGTTAIPGECNTPTCPSLRRFGLRYLRWLQPYEQFDLIPVFISIIRSRQQSMESFRIWTKDDEEDPLELIEGSSLSSKGLERLRQYAAITVRNL